MCGAHADYSAGSMWVGSARIDVSPMKRVFVVFCVVVIIFGVPVGEAYCSVGAFGVCGARSGCANLLRVPPVMPESTDDGSSALRSKASMITDIFSSRRYIIVVKP